VSVRRARRRLPGRDPEDAALATPTSIRLTREQIYFLDSFRARVCKDTGCRIPRGTLLQVLVEAVSSAAVDLRDVTSESDLAKLLRESSGPRRAEARP